jgi:hypothetical protein
MGPESPTVDLRNALNTGLVPGPRLIVAAHIISSSAGHGDMCQAVWKGSHSASSGPASTPPQLRPRAEGGHPVTAQPLGRGDLGILAPADVPPSSRCPSTRSPTSPPLPASTS